MIEFDSQRPSIIDVVAIVPHADASVYETITHTHYQAMKDSLLSFE